MNKLMATSLLVLLTGFSFSQRKIDSKFGKGLYNVIAADSSWSMKFGLRFQTLFVGEWDVNDTTGLGTGTSNFMIRRARLKFDGFAGHPRLKYKIELGVSNKDLGKVDARNNYAPRMILDAVLKWNFYQNFELWAGQTKLAGNRERVVSSANLQLVDRSLLNKNFTIDRDMGMQLCHHFTLGKNFLVREIFSVSQGEGRNLVQDNLGGYQYTSRIELLPFGKFASKGDYIGGDITREQKPKLSIAVSYDWNDRAVKDRSNQGSYMEIDEVLFPDQYFHADISTLFADLMFKYKGFSLMSEFAKRTAPDDQVEQTFSSDLFTANAIVDVGQAFNVQAGYLFKNNWEIAGRFTHIDPEAVTGKSDHSQYTFGVSKYVVGHKLKVQTDISYLTTSGSPDNGLMYRLQFDLHF